MRETGRLTFDGDYDRYFINDEIGIHCGSAIEILVVGENGEPKWEATYIEKGASGWYAVGFSNISLDGLWARTFNDDGEGI